MDLKEIYASKLVSAEQAAAVVKSGDWVDYGWTTGTPVAVDKALAARLPQLHSDVGARDLQDRGPRGPHDLEQLAHERH